MSESPEYTIWWQLSDGDRSYMKQCEVMVQLLSHSSQLKEDDFRFKRSTLGERMCTLCDHAAPDNAMHMIMQCPHHTAYREEMQRKVCKICPDFGAREVFFTILGKPLEGINPHEMSRIWKITCVNTAKMYWETIRNKRALYNNNANN